MQVSKYWACQVIGWGLLLLINLFFAISFDKYNFHFLSRISISVALGILISHFMRLVILRFRLLLRPIDKQIIGFVSITIFFAIIFGLSESMLANLFGLRLGSEKRLPVSYMLTSAIIYSFGYLFIWNCIYFIYHYIEKSRKQSLINLELESLVRELELKSIQSELRIIKSHINPHFIFNALNSIRALVDEDPPRARKAITELSNILRSSLLVEKMETVEFEKEFEIVRDYLELEQIRFDERLKTSYSIEDSTAKLPVPPMLIQTLVENAIKHGLSKEEKGGEIRISSRMADGSHEIVVINTGRLDNAPHPKEGFGLNSTRSRLKMIFGEKASFEIKQAGPLVEARILLPL